MADDDLRRYLELFTEKAIAAGLNMRQPGQNWAPMRDLIKGSHISLSVGKGQIQVNLNNEQDAAREQFNKLHKDKDEIESEIGTSLIWEAKPGVKKSAVRATLERGFVDIDLWDTQHGWAIETMKKFESAFGKRL